MVLFEYFRDDFMKSVVERSELDVSIIPLLNKHQCSTPMKLNYDRTINKNLPEVILSNFCMKHKDVQNYRKVGLVALLSLLTIPESDESAAIGILLVHLTKLDLPDARLNSYFGNFRKLTVKKTLESHQKKWIELAASLLKHPEIQSTVGKLVEKFGYHPQEPEIEFVLVENVSDKLRGFSGMEQIFINANHFDKKQQEYMDEIKNEILFEQVVRMDMVSLILHEYGHVKLWKSAGNFNLSTPRLAKQQNFSSDYVEFGALTESTVFGSRVDWAASQYDFDEEFVKEFLVAVEKGKDLPKRSVRNAVVRPTGVTFGIDMDVYSTYMDM